MPSRDPLLLQAIQLLSMRVGALKDQRFGELFSLTSCLNLEEREIIGYSEAFISMFPEDPLSKELRGQFIPAMIKIGVARWRRTELTHLGGKLADQEQIDIVITKTEEPPEVEYVQDQET